MKEYMAHEKTNKKLTPYLSAFEAWGIALGCSIGWGCFIMPGTTFLPLSGTLGTMIGIAAGALLMVVIGINYHHLINRFPDAGGAYSYTKEAFGYDHGFLCSWFLVLTYIAIVWANATAIPLVARYIFGDTFQFGYLYSIAGYDIYLGEALLSACALLLSGILCMVRKKAAATVEVLLAVVFFVGIVIAFLFAVKGSHTATILPAWASGNPPVSQILRIVAIAPWAYVGFESISNSSEEFTFSRKKAGWILITALAVSALAYILMAGQAALGIPAGYASWTEYISSLDGLSGIRSVPTISAAVETMGEAGRVLMGITIFGALFTSLLGCMIGASRLMYAMASDSILPGWVAATNEDGTPWKAILFIVAISLFVPFLGRTAVGWHVDISNIGAAVAYGYTSAAVYKLTDKKRMKITGFFGAVISVLFAFLLLVPNYISGSILATESYLILAGWCIIGFIFFRIVLQRDRKNRFGKGMVVWFALLALIFLTSLMWERQSSWSTNRDMIQGISQYYSQEMEGYGIERSEADRAEEDRLIQDKMDMAEGRQLIDSIVQGSLLMITLIIMFNVYSIMRKREKQMEEQKEAADAQSRAKSAFLSNMSHDIRTPMNAIIGFTHLAREHLSDPERTDDYLTKIQASSEHLLALINDVLEMSRIESGKIEMNETPCSLREIMEEMEIMVAGQAEARQQHLDISFADIRDENVYCDRLRINQVLLNLISNAVKYTQTGGEISVRLAQLDQGREGYGSYELRVKDNGTGMSPEFAERIFDAFEREQTSTVSGIQGTGLGMAITKKIVDLMGGRIQVITEQGKGSEFIVSFDLRLQEEIKTEESEAEAAAEADFSRLHVLLVEDIEINREIAMMMLGQYNLQVDYAVNGEEAVERIKTSKPGTYDLIFMDIQMPVMNGYDAARAIRALEDHRLSAIPIFAMTANAFQEDRQMAMDSGMNGHISKPIDMQQLTEALLTVL